MAEKVEYNLNLDLTLHPIQSILIKQYSKNVYKLIVSVTKETVVYVLNDSLYNVYFKMRTPDNRYVYTQGSIDENGRILLDVPESAAWTAGIGEAEFEIIKKDKSSRMSTCTFEVVIDASSYEEAEITGDNDFSALVDYISQAADISDEVAQAKEYRDEAVTSATTASQAAQTATTAESLVRGLQESAAASATVAVESKESAEASATTASQAAQSASEDAEATSQALQEAMALYNGPLTAKTAAEMTQTNRIYVYTGSESGYTFGNWYYYNGSTWQSGGTYNATAMDLDDTLTVEGKAADAKAVGDEIESFRSYSTNKFSNLEMTDDSIREDVTSLKADFNEFSGVNGISGQSINGSANIDTAITETVTQNNYWYPTGNGTIASGGAKEGMDKAVFDITNMSGKIAIGFDPNARYGSGSMVVGLSSSAVSPYTRVTYFSVSNVQVTPNYFTVNGNVVTADLDALKSAYPTAVLMFVNVPHNVWKLDNITTFKKTLHWLSIAGYVPSIVVAADGSGDYTTITEAISAASNGDTIYIKDGEYKETVVVNKYVHLVGQSKQGTILYQDIGDYNNCPLLITQGSVCNMTIKSLAPDDTSGLSSYAYAIHLDKNFASEAKYQKCEIYNCDIYSEVNDAIGAGTNYASEYDIHDCLLHVAHNPVKAGACGFKCHNGQNQTTGKVTLRNNVTMTEDANGTSCYDILFHNGGISNTQPIDIILVGNVLKHYHNGITNIFVPSDYNYGNSVAEMNTLS